MDRRRVVGSLLIAISLASCVATAERTAPSPTSTAPATAPPPPASTPSTDAAPELPTDAPEGPKPASSWTPGDGGAAGLAVPSSSADRAAARALIERAATAGRGPKTGYEREQFGPRWTDDNESGLFARNGCDTRNDILGRDLAEVVHRPGTRDCVVVAGQLPDPYGGELVVFAKEDAAAVPIDHVVSLSYAWQLGAARWDEARRRAFANDPLNLLATTRSANSAKGDSGPASWLPPQRSIRCGYVARYVAVALAYDLPITAPDKEMALRQCAEP